MAIATLVISIVKVVGVALYPIIEYFLGKTSSGSVIGVILNALSSILKSLGGSSSSFEEKK